MAFETRYEVSTQVLSSTPEERLPAMCGRATLAMLVSSTSMKVESMTVSAMIQGLIAGRARLGIWKSACAIVAIDGLGRTHPKNASCSVRRGRWSEGAEGARQQNRLAGRRGRGCGGRHRGGGAGDRQDARFAAVRT